MANPTTNYGFVLPTPTDLVTDLPADFDVALQGVDTRLKALQPGTTSGDLAYSSATANTNVRLPIGTSGQVLAVSGGGVPAWTTTADVTPLTTKGDLFTFSTVDARLGVGANNTVLVADSAEATGLKWATPTASGSSYTLLSTTTASGTTTTITGLGGYNELIIVFGELATTTATSTLRFTFNGDSGNNYDYYNTDVRNPATIIVSSGQATAQTFVTCSRVGSPASNISGFITMSGADTANKKLGQFVAGGQSNNQDNQTQVNGQYVYNSASTISSIGFNYGGATFASGTIRIYGSVI